MGKVSINPALRKLSPKEFKKWFADNVPEPPEKWELYYKEIGGKLPTKSTEPE